MPHVNVSPSASVALSVKLKGIGEPSSLMLNVVELPSVMIGGWFWIITGPARLVANLIYSGDDINFCLTGKVQID